MSGLKAFATGFGVTSGVILGLYAGLKGIEAIGYFTCKQDTLNEKQLEARIKDAARKIAAGQNA